MNAECGTRTLGKPNINRRAVIYPRPYAVRVLT